MARQRSRKAPQRGLPFTKKNKRFFLLGLGLIVVGYIFLRIPPAEGFFSLTLAPILLVAGYCVVIPIAILIRDKKDTPSSTR